MWSGILATKNGLLRGLKLSLLPALMLFLVFSSVTEGVAQAPHRGGRELERQRMWKRHAYPAPPAQDEPVTSEDWAKADFYGFIDIHQRLRQPSETVMDNGLRLLTAPDFPPFNYRNKSGAPVGYHVELARAFCEQLNIACTMKVVPFDAIPDLLESDQADAALAGLVRHPDLQGKVSFSNVFLKRPGRFLQLKDTLLRADKQALQGKPVARHRGLGA